MSPDFNRGAVLCTHVHDCLTRIFVHWICNTDELVEMLRNSLPQLLQEHERKRASRG